MPSKKLVLDNNNRISVESAIPAREAPARPEMPTGPDPSATVGRVRKCPSCESNDILFDSERGELVCNNCGLVIEENATYSGPEWRAFDADQRNSRARTGAPIRYTKPNKGLVTEIDLYNKDIRGVRIPSKRQAQLYRMRKWHKRASIASSSERNYLIALAGAQQGVKLSRTSGKHQGERSAPLQEVRAEQPDKGKANRDSRPGGHLRILQAGGDAKDAR